jgi:hypothetical protein
MSVLLTWYTVFGLAVNNFGRSCVDFWFVFTSFAL